MPLGGRPRTKIVATLGPACEAPEVLDRMIRAGMSVARINLAHGTPSDHERMVRAVRRAARRTGLPVAVMVDLAGPKIRVGDLTGGKVHLETGRRVRLTGEPILGTPGRISVTEARFLRDARPGQPIFLADGTLELRVVGARGGDLACEVVSGGLLLPAKGVNVPRTRLRLPSLTAQDERDLVRALGLGVDAVAQSFVRSPADLHRARRRMGRRRVPLIAKIEKREAVEHFDAILATADGVMVARGDLAVETSLEEVPLLQKQIIRAANAAAKPVITATQMLLSMVDQPRPTRAEAADVANAILDGTDAVMLSEETARGAHPGRVVETMARLAVHTERRLVDAGLRHGDEHVGTVAEAVSEAAVHAARDLGARAIVTPTWGGGTARMTARWRPPVPVVALTENPSTASYLCLTWGVHPILRRRLGAFEGALRAAEDELGRLGLARPGERYVVTASHPRRYTSNLLTVQVLGGPGAAPMGRRRPRAPARP